MPVKKNCCFITNSSGRRTWKGLAKWKAINVVRDGPRGSCRIMTLNIDMFIFGCLQFVKSQNLHAAICSIRHGT